MTKTQSESDLDSWCARHAAVPHDASNYGLCGLISKGGMSRQIRAVGLLGRLTNVRRALIIAEQSRKFRTVETRSHASPERNSAFCNHIRISGNHEQAICHAQSKIEVATRTSLANPHGESSSYADQNSIKTCENCVEFASRLPPSALFTTGREKGRQRARTGARHFGPIFM